MALRVVRGEPVILPYGDAYLLRLAREHRRLEHAVTVTLQELELRKAELAAGMVARNLTSLDLAEVTITRTRAGITIA